MPLIARCPRLVAGLALLACMAGPAAAQVPVTEPWAEWRGPPTDGIAGLQFGMDRFKVEDAAAVRGWSPRPPRAGTLRYALELLDRRCELVALFVDDAAAQRGGELATIDLRWQRREGLPGPSLERYARLSAFLVERYGDPVFTQDDGEAALLTGSGALRQLFHGPQTRAVLELVAPRPERYELRLRLEHPPLSARLAADEDGY